MVVLGDLEGLFQPRGFYDSKNLLALLSTDPAYRFHQTHLKSSELL